jgi:DNA-binding GntR family transcriptional regulator
MDSPRFQTKTDMVAELLRIELLRGIYRPGTQLRQEDVAQRFGVSPTPVREAFGILQAEGFLERRPHRGVVSVLANLRNMDDAYEIRGLVEALAVRRLIERKDSVAVAELARLLETESAVLRESQTHQFRLIGLEFHRAIARGSGSDSLMEVHALLSKRTMFRHPLDKGGMSRSHREHRELLEAIDRGAATKAARLVARHMAWNASLVRRAKRAAPRRRAQAD